MRAVEPRKRTELLAHQHDGQLGNLAETLQQLQKLGYNKVQIDLITMVINYSQFDGYDRSREMRLNVGDWIVRGGTHPEVLSDEGFRAKYSFIEYGRPVPSVDTPLNDMIENEDDESPTHVGGVTTSRQPKYKVKTVPADVSFANLKDK